MKGWPSTTHEGEAETRSQQSCDGEQLIFIRDTRDLSYTPGATGTRIRMAMVRDHL